MKISIAGGILMAIATGHALAADWSIDPKVAASAVYNDNNRLTEVSGREIKVSGAKLDAELAIRAGTPRSSFELTPRLRSNFYPADSTEEADDQFVRMLARYWTQTSTASLGVNYSRMVTLGDYFPTSAVGEDDVLGNPDRGVGVGGVGRRNREDRLALAPELSFKLSPRRSLVFKGEYLDVGYDIQAPGDRTDYSNIYGSISFAAALSQTSTLAIRGGYSKYDPDDGDSTDVQSIEAEWTNDLSETAQAYVRAGGNRFEVTPGAGGGGKSSWETGYTGSVGVRWAFEVTDIWLDASHNLDPNGSGDIVTRDEVRVQLARRLRPTTRVFISGRLIKDSRATNFGSFQDRTYATGRVGFDWRFAQQWTLFGSYQYAQRDYQSAISTAESNAIDFGIVYQPNRR